VIEMHASSKSARSSTYAWGNSGSAADDDDADDAAADDDGARDADGADGAVLR
jgi:hypothetical protein